MSTTPTTTPPPTPPSPTDDLHLPSPTDNPTLWQAYHTHFHTNGYLVLDNYWSPTTCSQLRTRMAELIEKFDLHTHKSVFSTNEQNRTSDEYFLGSGDQVRFFWEEDAFDAVTGDFLHPRTNSINKVGHALHDLDPLFHQASYTPQLGLLARKVGDLHTPLVAQSMYIFKQPRIGGKVGAHQDGTFLYTEPQSVVGFWWALEDCTTTNGCLWAIPGSHKEGVQRRFRRKHPDGKDGTEFVPHTHTHTHTPPPEENTQREGHEGGDTDTDTDTHTHTQKEGREEEWDLTKAIPLEVKEGSLVLLHHALVHYSLENRSSASRHAYSIHVVEGGKGTVYPSDNWLQRPEGMPFQMLPS